MEEFKLNRKLVSSYYIAATFSFFLFQLTKGLLIFIAGWLISVIANFGISTQGNGIRWLALFLVCFFVTFWIKRMVVIPLGFHISDEGAPSWELFVGMFLVFGFYVYIINQIFGQPMPNDWLGASGPSVTKFFGGFENTYITTYSDIRSEQKAVWVFVPWLWNLGPLVFLYVRTRLIKS